MEWQWNNGWSKTAFKCPALPGTDITAVLYRAPRGQVLSLIYFVVRVIYISCRFNRLTRYLQGPDRILHEKVQFLQLNRGNLDKAWEDVKYVATTAQASLALALTDTSPTMNRVVTLLETMSERSSLIWMLVLATNILSGKIGSS